MHLPLKLTTCSLVPLLLFSSMVGAVGDLRVYVGADGHVEYALVGSHGEHAAAGDAECVTPVAVTHECGPCTGGNQAAVRSDDRAVNRTAVAIRPSHYSDCTAPWTPGTPAIVRGYVGIPAPLAYPVRLQLRTIVLRL